VRTVGVDIIGRERELRVVEAFLTDARSDAGALVLDGEPGIGKSTLWLAGLDSARHRRLRTVSCRPAEAEVGLPFVSLGDLLEPVLDEVLPALRRVHAEALEAALTRAAPTEGFDRLTVSRAALAVFQALAAEEPPVVAIDDVQWLDASSGDALEFAFRRLASLPVRLLLARRANGDEEAPLGLARAFGRERVEIVRVGPLSAAEITRLLRLELGLRLPRPRAAELHRISGGNPFYALEIGRALERRESGDAWLRLPVPETLTALVADRLAALPAETEHALRIAALLGEPTVDALATLVSTPRTLHPQSTSG